MMARLLGQRSVVYRNLCGLSSAGARAKLRRTMTARLEVQESRRLAEQIQQAQGTLTQLQERIAGEDAAGALNWFRVDQVLDSPTLSANTKYYALQVGRPPPTLARRAARADAPPPPPPRRRSSRR